MTNTAGRKAFLESDKASELREELTRMVKSPAYNTGIGSSEPIDGQHAFVDKYMEYMSRHPGLDHWQYLSNLKLMTRVK